jgi:hypothetical protein
MFQHNLMFYWYSNMFSVYALDAAILLLVCIMQQLKLSINMEERIKFYSAVKYAEEPYKPFHKELTNCF